MFPTILSSVLSYSAYFKLSDLPLALFSWAEVLTVHWTLFCLANSQTKSIFSHHFFYSPYPQEDLARNLVSSFNSSRTFIFVFNQIWTILPLSSFEFLYSLLQLTVSRYRSLELIQAFEKYSPLAPFLPFYNPFFIQMPGIVILKHRPDQKII